MSVRTDRRRRDRQMDGVDGKQCFGGLMREKEKRKSMRNVFCRLPARQIITDDGEKKGIDLRASRLNDKL